MRAVVQRVSEARVEVDGRRVGEIGLGFLVLVGVAEGDTDQDAEWLSEKVSSLRVFEDSNGKMNLSVHDVAGSMLVVSQFTLLGDCRKGRRPSYDKAARPDAAERLYRKFVEMVRAKGLAVEEGAFQARMKVHLVNNGPVTLIVDSRKAF